MGAVIKATPKAGRNTELSACAGKAAFEDRTTAMAAGERLRRRERVRGLVVYHCPYCHKLHLGVKNEFKSGSR